MMNSMMGIIFLFGVVTASNYSYPRILILGPTGVGKSSLGNVLAGCEPSDEDCFFPICNGIDSCTKETTIAEATFLGQLAGETTAILDGNVTLIDSPGFGDTDLEQPTLIAEMIDVLKNNLQEANTILLCFEKGRWNGGILKMIEELESLFGRDRLWNNVILEITKWAFDSKSIADRERQGITEAGTMAEINKKLQENFHLNHSLPGVFIDSYAVYYLEDDEVQKQYFFNYSLTLWEAANTMEPFTFYTIEDILNQLHTCQIENDCLNQVLEERITRIENNVDNINSTVTNDINELINDVADNQKQIQKNELYIDTNMDNIDINANKIDINTHNIDTNTQNIDSNTNKMDTNTHNIGSNANKIGTNTHNIGSNTNKIGTNTRNIDSNANKIGTNTHNTGSNSNKIGTNTHNIGSNTNKIGTNTHNIATNKKTIDTLTETTSRFVSYCGHRHYTERTGTLTYTRLVTSANSFSRGGLNIATGVFTPPTQGTYLVNVNFYTAYDGEFEIYINKNGHDLDEGKCYSRSIDGGDGDMTGRTLTMQLGTNDKLYLHAYRNDGGIYDPTFCITLIK